MSAPELFPGFATHDVDVDGVRIHARVGGSGSPVLLLHGYPQTHAMWHHVAPELARDHTVVLPDLRGYGASDRPADTDGHAAYGKRAMAADQAGLMRALGHERFAVVGHDRGARVTHRLVLDHPGAVTRAAVLDIVPTHHVFTHVTLDLALAYDHWFFLGAPGDLPEHYLGLDPEHWVRAKLGQWSRGAAFDERAVAEYVRGFSDPAGIHATCEDYRAAPTVDLADDTASFDAGERITCPLLVLWGADGFVGGGYEVEQVWRAYATDVHPHPVPGGHFVAEEQPAAVTSALQQFLSPSPR